MAEHLKIMNKRMVLLNPVSSFKINIYIEILVLYVQKSAYNNIHYIEIHKSLGIEVSFPR